MHYTTETLDRRTGDLAIVSLGEWITVSELGKKRGLGPKQIRAVLHHMGVLQQEGCRYRLPHSYVIRGLGKRIDKSRSSYPFDVLSPACQVMIDEAWDDTVEDYTETRAAEEGVIAASIALALFEGRRSRPLQAQEGVCWLLDHFPSMTFEAIAKVLEVDRALISRYAKRREENRSFRRWSKGFAPSPGFADTAWPSASAPP